MDIKHCAAIITGGASGMGAATATLLSQLGAKVALLDLNQEAAAKTAEKIGGMAIQCDVRQPESVEAALEEAKKHQGAARICINCAGIVHGRRMINQQGPMPLDEFRKVIEINLIGTFNVTRLAAAEMMKLDPMGDSEE